MTLYKNKNEKQTIRKWKKKSFFLLLLLSLWLNVNGDDEIKKLRAVVETLNRITLIFYNPRYMNGLHLI